MMFIRVIIEASVINTELVHKLMIPIGGMLITMLGHTVWNYYFKKAKSTPIMKRELEVETPFSLGPAIKFSLFFVVILFMVKITEMYLGDKGVYLTALVSGLADVDAITISLSKLSLDAQIAQDLAIRGITYAVISNTFIKIIYIHLFGSKKMRDKMLTVFTSSSLVGIALSLIV